MVEKKDLDLDALEHEAVWDTKDRDAVIAELRASRPVVAAGKRTKAARAVAFAAPYMKQPNELGVAPIHEAERLLREAERTEDVALADYEASQK